jgi:hypothetical protein
MLASLQFCDVNEAPVVVWQREGITVIFMCEVTCTKHEGCVTQVKGFVSIYEHQAIRR